MKFAIVLALAAIASVHAALSPKALSGPPSEFASMELPSPTLALLDSDKAMFFVTLSEGVDGTPFFKQSFQVDSTVGFALSTFSPLSALKFQLTGPSGQDVPLTSGTPTYFPVSDSAELNVKFAGTLYEFDAPAVGTYILSVTAPGMSHSELLHAMSKISSSSNQAIVFVFNSSPDLIASHMTHYQSVVGQQIGLNTRMFDSVAHGEMVRGVVPNALKDVVTEADMEVIFPDGHVEKVSMHDDGAHFDGEANDGAFGAQIVPSMAGSYVMQALLSGTNAAGAPFVRTTEHFINVVKPSIQLTGQAAVSIHPLQNRLFVELFVEGQAANEAQQFRAYIEVYGTSFSGKQVPVAWASMISPVQQTVRGGAASQFLPLELDLHWFAKAQAVGPLTLKSVWIQDVESLVPLNDAAAIEAVAPTNVLSFINETVSAILASGYKGEVTKVMMEGQAPAHLHLKSSNSSSNGGVLLALHGYCATANPWAKSPADFTNAAFPTDLNQARSIAAYSEIVVNFAAANGYTSYGLVGHSLGGMVSLNILNAYHTGVDAAVGNRKIQSLASPLLGNGAAGSADSMKTLFGAGCGTLYDLTVDGANLWLSGVSANAKSQLNFYTTQYDKGGLFGQGWCNMIMNSVLDNPNDGATELSRAVLSGAINRGHTVGQCHIEDMNWPASFLDHTRNAEINANAAR